MSNFSDPELIDVRTDERLDTSRLEPYLREHLEGAEGELDIAQFGGGHANLTYMLKFGEREYVLRRPPLGPVAPSAHDMTREHRVLSRLWNAFPLAPRSFLLCQDHDIIGADFHVMERRRGIVIRTEMPKAFEGKPDLNRRIGEMLVDTLADLHTVDPAAVGLEDLGHPDGFVARQVEGWTKRWHASKDKDMDTIDRLIAWLADTMPPSRHVSLLHNDFKLDNMIVDAIDPATPVAVLDWDMCTRGDPLLDLGNMLNYYTEATDPSSWRSVTAMPSWNEGFPTRDTLVRRYGERTGFEVGDFAWYHAFGAFKLAVVLQQIYIRYLKGQTKDERFSTFGQRVEELAAKGHAIAGL
ncbi:MAG: phosphotransferase family protein [Rhodospirillales bacterium]|nr:phosphotransferase family protein [Rhodospirillales bacterium]